jgi:predicted nucleic acid-binding protein
VETSVFSLLVARPSKDALIAERQRLTRLWWMERADDFELFVSSLVAVEARAGDASMAQQRLAYIHSVEELPIEANAIRVSKELLRSGILPAKCADDAMHLAVAATSRMDFLATWDMRHLANKSIQDRAKRFLQNIGYAAPIVCTLANLFGDFYAP